MDKWVLAAVAVVVIVVGIAIAYQARVIPFIPGYTPVTNAIISEVSINYASCHPQSINSSVGGIVDWRNGDGASYQFTLTGPENSSSGLIGGGHDYVIKFNKTGTYTLTESRYGFACNVIVG